MRPENFVNTISQKPIKEFPPISITGVFGFIDVLIRFLGLRSKIKVTRDNNPKKQGEYNIVVIIGVNFTKIRSHAYMGQET